MMNQEEWKKIADYLESKGHTLDLSVSPAQLSGGVANFNYSILLDGKKAVLRRPPNGPLPPGANDVAREYKVLSRLYKHYPPAPAGLVFCDDESVIGVPFCISEFREGICISRNLPESLKNTANIGDDLSRLVVESLAGLHKVDLKKADLEDLGSADGFIERQVSGWYKRGSRVLTEPQLKQLATIRDWLQSHLPDNKIATLVHNDFKLDNMLIDIDTLHVNGVVDWDMCTVGDPFYELAIMLAYWGNTNDVPAYKFQCRMPMEAEGWWSREKVIEEYLRLTGLSVNEQDLKFYQWLTYYRNIVVYGQLQKLFEKTGECPAVLTEEEFNGIADNNQLLLDTIEAEVKAQ
ncbi:phosphotransferase family protein [Colwellia sp. 20A7]|uniref:phosphotransferase family protein n=1 Tax=Colwellia sp. 20A7 TaxID=2689569 RepID=UPI001358AC21|nr:phosphotransferase family protein [Colwellia sp. 20A7]